MKSSAFEAMPKPLAFDYDGQIVPGGMSALPFFRPLSSRTFKVISTLIAALSLLMTGTQAPPTAEIPDGLRTVAERSDYRATAKAPQVDELCRALAKSSRLVHLTEIGKTSEGRAITTMIVADPPVTTAVEASRTGKLVVLLLGNIHAGEVDGKEALPMLVRDLVTNSGHPLLKDLILVVVPNLNADGNEQVARTNRPGQAGPEDGMGQRENASGLDLNRDFIKLDAPETRSLVRAVNLWDPHVIIDCHTTNGSYHRYTITYEGPKNPAGDPRIIEYVRKQFLPHASEAFTKKTGLNAFFYGNFAQDHTRWTTYPASPRYGTTYLGLRNRIAILSEAYSYAPFKTRVLATRDFVFACLEEAAGRKGEIRKLLGDAREGAIAAGRDPKPDDKIAIRSQAKAFPEKVEILGFVEREENSRMKATDESKDYHADLVLDFEPTASVSRPWAYVIPGRYAAVAETLQRHGLTVNELREDLDLDVEAYRVDKIDRAPRKYERHEPISLTVTARRQTQRVEAGSFVVPTAQALGSLAVYLLEPGSDDSLATWNAFDSGLAEGSDFPVLRLLHPAPLSTIAAHPLPEDHKAVKPITYASLGTGRSMFAFSGSTATTRWLDGEHWAQVKQGKLYKVEARTGKAELFLDQAKFAKGLASIPSIDADTAASWSQQTSFNMDPKNTGALFNQSGDLYYARFDGSLATRLMNIPGSKESPGFSPDGKSVAFVWKHDLYVVDIATCTLRPLTKDGSETIRNGETDWVYGEEIFNRSKKAYWWSPDSTHIAFLGFDDSPVPLHTITNEGTGSRKLEPTPYPRAGEPNPFVRLGIADAKGGSLKWADLSGYPRDTTIISHVGWWPDGKTAYCYVQDRAQTWLDFVNVSAADGSIKRLFRETTKAWVESPGDPTFLDDGSFLFLSERDGWKHIYHYATDGTLKRQVTSGPWEVRSILRAGASEDWGYFSATKDGSLAVNLYRVKLGGGPVERLSQGEGNHAPSLSPDGKLFLDAWSDRSTPTRVTLYSTDGTRIRKVDTNPVRAIEEYHFSPRERVTIKARDGFPIEAEIIAPPTIEPGKKYPVWLQTYAGPHAPTVSEGWAGGRAGDQALAAEGIIVFRVDPRSASGHGAASTWTAYKKLGVQELADLTDAVTWLVKSRTDVDPKRVGIEGHSYGGFMTAFALTHSDIFAAGIAGAPVTDWRDYDSIYTERYMGLPQDNPSGYDASSVVKAARNLQGKLLLVHGAIDDNVSVRNTLRLAAALQAADKDFELMIYPGSRHGGFGPHFNRLRIEFIRRSLGLAKPTQ